jgi:hypothetical protein
MISDGVTSAELGHASVATPEAQIFPLTEICTSSNLSEFSTDQDTVGAALIFITEGDG